VHNTTHYPDISWTSPINQILRADFVLEDEHSTTHTTIEDTLSHRTGLPRHDLIYGVAGDTPASIVQRLRHLPMTAEPRTTFQYCNLMYVVATEFLETVTGMKLETLLRDRLWKPLGMLSTSFTPALQSSSNIARGYYWDPSTTNHGYIPEPYLDLLPISGAGATISTVNDYALWIKALLSAADPHGPTNHSSPMTTAIFHDLVTPRTIISSNSPEPKNAWTFANPPLYSLGWITLNIAGETIIMHEGSLTGFGSAVYLLPEYQFGIVMMGNTEHTSNLAEAVLASVLLKWKLENARKLDGRESELVLEAFRETLLRISGLTLSKPNHNHPLKDHQTHNSAPHHHKTSLPLPGAIEDYAGLYTHPAYGSLNLTVPTNSSRSGSSTIPTLHAILCPRTWPRKLKLHHTTDTVFALEISSPHGLGDIFSDDDDGEILWEVEEDSARRAVFKFGLDGETVETMGIELEAGMVEMARGKGERAWKEGMIWLERVGG
jgi:CubicO group peptidase (beta-lactamase class C family)